MKVLISIEDDRDTVLLIRMLLQPDERLVVCGDADDIFEAIEIARELQPDLIVLDHFINGPLTGIDAAPLLKSVAPKSKILLYSMHDLRVEAEREPAVDKFLRKSDFSNLLDTARSMLDLESVQAV